MMYKVVRRVGDRLYSAIMTGDLKIKYTPLEWVETETPRIFFFTSIHAAVKWLQYYQEPTHELWYCQVKCVAFLDRMPSSYTYAEQFWNGTLPESDTIRLYQFTAVTNGIRLVKRVTQEDYFKELLL